MILSSSVSPSPTAVSPHPTAVSPLSLPSLDFGWLDFLHLLFQLRHRSLGVAASPVSFSLSWVVPCRPFRGITRERAQEGLCEVGKGIGLCFPSGPCWRSQASVPNRFLQVSAASPGAGRGGKRYSVHGQTLLSHVRLYPSSFEFMPSPL